MADRSSQLLLSALTRAAADTAGVPLHATKTTPGLFPATAGGKQAAQRCRDDGYLTVVEPTAGRNAAARGVITEKGLSYLLTQVSPRQVLEDFVRIVEEREAQMAQLVSTAREMQTGLESLRGTIAAVLARVSAPVGDLKTLFAEFRQEKVVDPTASIRQQLDRWAKGGASEDCPLPDLYRQVQATCPGLTIGSYHDALRAMHAAGRIWLHPWTGPLYLVPEPAYVLLVGHEIAYYASLQSN